LTNVNAIIAGSAANDALFLFIHTPGVCTCGQGINLACTASTVPYACCTGSGTGTCAGCIVDPVATVRMQ